MGKKNKKFPSPTKKIGRYSEIECLSLKLSWSSTPGQRLAWLKEAVEFAYRTGTLKPRRGLEE